LSRERRRTTGEVLIEEITPFIHHQLPGVRFAHLAGKPAVRIPIDHPQGSVDSPPPLAGAFQLAGVEGTVAATTDDHHVAELSLIG
jgi:hypothetical protein